MPQDVFCTIINDKDSKTNFLFKNEDLVVFEDTNPKAPLHYLIVPIKHISTIDEATSQDTELLGRMILAGQRAAKMLEISGAYKLVFNVGEAGGQIVPHIHLHLLGGFDKK